MNKMKDYLLRTMTTNKQIRALAVHSTGVVEEARRAHQTTPVATAALGRTLTGALLVGSLLKSGYEISLRITGDGPLNKIVAEANEDGEVRGYVGNPRVEFMTANNGKLDVGSAIGNGILQVKKDLGLKDPYEGKVELISGEIGEDLTYYFTRSEQTPSAVGLGVLIETDLEVKTAGGFLLQMLPEAEEETINKLENNLEEVSSVSGLFAEGRTPLEVLEIILEGFDFRILEEKEVEFNCHCDRGRVRELMLRLGREELEETLHQEGKVDIRCHFCNQIYNFSGQEVKRLLA